MSVAGYDECVSPHPDFSISATGTRYVVAVGNVVVVVEFVVVEFVVVEEVGVEVVVVVVDVAVVVVVSDASGTAVEETATVMPSSVASLIELSAVLGGVSTSD